MRYTTARTPVGGVGKRTSLPRSSRTAFLVSGKRQKIQLAPAFADDGRAEAREAVSAGTEPRALGAGTKARQLTNSGWSESASGPTASGRWHECGRTGEVREWTG